jgi:hypothetical protein
MDATELVFLYGFDWSNSKAGFDLSDAPSNLNSGIRLFEGSLFFPKWQLLYVI